MAWNSRTGIKAIQCVTDGAGDDHIRKSGDRILRGDTNPIQVLLAIARFDAEAFAVVSKEVNVSAEELCRGQKHDIPPQVVPNTPS